MWRAAPPAHVEIRRKHARVLFRPSRSVKTSVSPMIAQCKTMESTAVCDLTVSYQRTRKRTPALRRRQNVILGLFGRGCVLLPWRVSADQQRPATSLGATSQDAYRTCWAGVGCRRRFWRKRRGRRSHSPKRRRGCIHGRKRVRCCESTAASMTA